MATLKIYQNGAWVSVGGVPSVSPSTTYLSAIDIQEIAVSGIGDIEVATSFEYTEDMKLVLLSHGADLTANLTLSSFAQSDNSTTLIFHSDTAVDTTATVMSAPMRSDLLDDALAASREATAAAQTIRPYVDRIEQAAASIGVYHWDDITIPASAWSDGSATIEVLGVLETDFLHIAPVLSTDAATAIQQRENWGYIGRAESAVDAVIFECYDSVPSIDLPIQIEVLRGGRAEFVEEVEY